MTILDNLNTLENNIIYTKQILANNLNQKGVEVSVDDSLTYLAENVANISQEGGGVGEIDFSRIGYDNELPTGLDSEEIDKYNQVKQTIIVRIIDYS